MNVVFFQRKRHKGNFSVEGYFDTLRESMPTEIECTVAVSRFKSNGFFRRVYNIIEASLRQGDINHITGDVHFLCIFMRKRKTLLTILDCVFTQYTSGLKYKILKYFWYVIPEKRVSVISVISQSTKNELLKIISCNPDKIKVVPVCISSGFTYKEKEFNEAKPVILQVGTGENKNLMRLFEALHGVPCRVEIIGRLSAKQKDALREYSIEYGNVWDISEPEIIRKYQECDLVTLISTYEGFGMPILEANAVGRAVITSNILSMPEVAGNAACIVDPFDIQAIKNGIRYVIRDRAYRNMLIENGRNNVNRYLPENIAAQYHELYNQMLVH